ncbi:calmodulin-binding receptor-like cytoplasmic kinase 2 isoform X1 [Primulina eburnea]|uniref:calmodulin-binding receptor-like cytoplasmic kinase 2 isoform X1 n=1 Tax=Primulina eburnea TaxID=1245227 RepID=UPI003C6C02D6
MRSPLPDGGRRSAASNTPAKLARSSSYSTDDHSNNSHRSSARSAAHSIANALFGCFTPPDASKSSSNVFSDSSGASSSGSDRRRSIYGSSIDSTYSREPGSVIFTMKDINKATKNFSPALKIGQGGFGTVYKGQLADGTLVAVKRAKKIMYDKHLGTEFQNEIETLAQVEHLNLVKLYGFLQHGDERILVAEYVPNGNLREHLDGIKGDSVDFAMRLEIATDVAHAVTYLHMYTGVNIFGSIFIYMFNSSKEMPIILSLQRYLVFWKMSADHPIIHRDIKSSNILLTENLRAKVADFGFARLRADGESGATHISTQVKGTAGYLDPEYLETNQLTEKSDVYSFGVLLVELVTGRRPIEPKREQKERITAKWAMRKFSCGEAILTLDPRLVRCPANSFALEKILELAFSCLAPHRHNRPSMRKCAEILWEVRKDYREFSVFDALTLPSKSPVSNYIREV